MMIKFSLKEINEMLESLEKIHFWGEVTLIFQNGDIVLYKEDRTVKPGGTMGEQRILKMSG